jgi:hypothetical protein
MLCVSKKVRLRAKDTLTSLVAPRLVAVADTPAALLARSR